VTRLRTLITNLVLVTNSTSSSTVCDDSLVSNGCTRGCKAIPGHVVQSSALEALDRRQRRGVQPTAWGRSTRSEASLARSSAESSAAVGANPSDMPKATARVALLTSALNPQTRAFGLNMSDSSTGVALFRSDSTRLRASSTLMSRLATVIAEPLLRRTSLDSGES